MRTRKRYTLDRVYVAPLESRPATWTFAGTGMRGTERTFAVTDTNLPTRNEWEFIIRLPADPTERIEVRPKTTPNLKAWDTLTKRSLTFNRATRGTARGKWYCQVALADATGERSKAVVPTDQRDRLPHWFGDLSGRMRRKETVKPTRGTDGNVLVVLIAAGDYPMMIRLFFATKVWVLSERIIL
jgi:hypothetical protein